MYSSTAPVFDKLNTLCVPTPDGHAAGIFNEPKSIAPAHSSLATCALVNSAVLNRRQIEKKKLSGLTENTQLII